jgi:integrase
VTTINLPYLDPQRGRDGRVAHWYFRRGGRRWPLPGDPASPEFAVEYQRLLQLTEPGEQAAAPIDRRTYGPGSFGRLVNDYLASGNFKKRKPSTAAEYRRVLEGLQRDHGDKPVALLRYRHVRQMRDERAETPGAANTIVRMLKIVLNFAKKDGWIEVNPAAGMELFEVGEWRSWTDEECAAFEKCWAPGTMQRRAYSLAIHTAQRKSDLVAMTRAHRANGAIRVKQRKTGEQLWIPEHRELTAELARGVATLDALLITSEGKTFDPVYFGAWFAAAIDAAGLPDDCVLHGLRKSGAQRLADAGCTEQEIMAVTGITTPRMVHHYTKVADQRKRARAAIQKLENAK